MLILLNTDCKNNILNQRVLTYLAQVNLNCLVVFTSIIWDQVIFELISHRGNLYDWDKERKRSQRIMTKHAQTNSRRLTCTTSCIQIRLHAMVVGENGCGGSNLSPHVTDGGHPWQMKESVWANSKICSNVFSNQAIYSSWSCQYFFFPLIFIITSARDGVNSRPMILHNSPSAALYSQDASNLQDDILWRSPAWQTACQLHSNHLEGKHRKAKAKETFKLNVK